MSVAEMRREASEIRARLKNPPNAVVDRGICLKPNREPKLEPVKVKAEFDPFMRAVARPQLPYGVGTSLPRYSLVYSIGEAFGYVAMIKNIQRVVCNAAGIDLTELLSARRTGHVVRARMVAIYLAKKLTKKSLPELGRRFDRDHTTILHSIRQIEKALLVEPALREDLQRLELLVASPSQPEDAICSSPPITAA